MVAGDFIVDRPSCLQWQKHFSAGSPPSIDLNYDTLHRLQQGKQVVVKLLCGKGDLAAAWILKAR